MKIKFNSSKFEGCNLSSTWWEICIFKYREERSKISNIRFYQNKLQKEKTFKLKVNRRKEVVKIVADINDFENGKIIKKYHLK